MRIQGERNCPSAGGWLTLRNGRPRLIASIWLLVLSAVYTFGQTTSTQLNLEDCVRLPQSAPSSSTLAPQQTQITRYGIAQARANFLPQLSIGSSFTYNSPLFYDRHTFSFLPLNGIREYSMLPTTALEPDTPGRLRATRDRARADRDAANANLGLSERHLKHTVAASFYRLFDAHRLGFLADARRARAELLPQASIVFQYSIDAQRVPM